MIADPSRPKRQDYLSIVKHYESCLARHGDNHLGVDWPNAQDAQTRYQVMLDLLPQRVDEPLSLLDFGCGASHFYEFLSERGRSDVQYSGLDISRQFVDLSQRKFPHLSYYCSDVLTDKRELPDFDYVVLNGVFTEKLSLTYDDMYDYFRQLLTTLFPMTRKAMAFNVMSKHVEWERDDLFHVPFDTMADFVRTNLSRHFAFRQDYGLYEYTVYVSQPGTN